MSQQTRDFGIRIALGAGRAAVVSTALKGSLGFLGCGAVVGCMAAAGLTQFLRSVIYGVTPTDPATFATVGALMTVTAVSAGLVPTRRATRVDPLVALRDE